MAGLGNEFARHYMEPKEENGKRIDMLFYDIFNEADTMTGFRMRSILAGHRGQKDTKPRTSNSDRNTNRMVYGNEFMDVDLKQDDMFAS